MTDRAPTSDVSPEHFRKTFESWWRTASSIIGTLAAALGALQVRPPWNYILAIGALATGGGMTWALYRRSAARAARRAAPSISPPSELLGAFRELRRFRQGEMLPGEQRRREAKLLVGQIQDPKTFLTIVTGDSGAGKSSLVDCAVAGPLSSAGWSVSTYSLRASDSTAAALVARWAAKPFHAEVSAGTPELLILDQFEEILAKFKSDQDAEVMGAAIQRAIDEGRRVVVVTRKESLTDLTRVTARLSDRIPFDDIRIVRNFSIHEAAGVIRECVERDHISCDPQLPETVAEDLANDGLVRPPDLQIVCSGLRGEMTVHNYRREGGAVGLRSSFVRTIIDLTGSPHITRAILRMMCDLPQQTKRADSLTVAALMTQLRQLFPDTSEALVTDIVAHLTDAYILTERGASSYALIHDYLVEPIKLVTEEHATRVEVASNELDYFLSEVRSHRRAVIPLQRLRFILKYAPRTKFHNREVQRLINRSRLRG